MGILVEHGKLQHQERCAWLEPKSPKNPSTAYPVGLTNIELTSNGGTDHRAKPVLRTCAPRDIGLVAGVVVFGK